MARNDDDSDDDATLPEPAGFDPSASPLAAVQPAAPPKSLMKTLAATALVTVLAAAAGGLYGMQAVPMVTTLLEAKPKVSEPAGIAHYPQGTSLKDLAPIITNLAQPPETWVRLEASLVLDPKQKPLPDVLVGEIGNDVLSYMRTVTLKQIEGANGLRQLGEDLNERVTIRSEGRVREVIIQTLVVQ
jgi:flagellar FliL protein